MFTAIRRRNGRFCQSRIKQNNVQVITGQSAVAFEEEGQVIRLEDGQTLDSDLTILSVGSNQKIP